MPSRLVANAHFMWAFCFLAQIWPISGPLLAHESRAFYLTTIGFWPSKPQDAFKFFKCDRVYKNLDTSCMNLITRTPKDIPAYGREPPHKYLSPTPAFETKRTLSPTASMTASRHRLSSDQLTLGKNYAGHLASRLFCKQFRRFSRG